MFSDVNYQRSQLTQESVWSELSMIFQKEKTKVMSKLGEARINVNLQDPSDEQRLNICHFVAEIQNFTKNVQKLLQCKVSDIQREKVKAQSQEKIKKVQEQRQNQQKTIQTLSLEKKNLQILLRTYEKVLSGLQNKKSVLNQKSEQYPIQTIISSISSKRDSNIDSLTIQKTYDIKIQGKEQELYSSRQLSSSRLACSRMSRLGVNSGALRDLQSNWNKSVNVTSKSFKSTKKQYDRSVQKDDNKFFKSHIKEKQLSRSSVKENIPKGQQVKTTNELDDSYNQILRQEENMTQGKETVVQKINYKKERSNKFYSFLCMLCSFLTEMLNYLLFPPSSSFCSFQKYNISTTEQFIHSNSLYFIALFIQTQKVNNMLHLQTGTQSFQLPQYQSTLLKKQKQSKIIAPKVTHIHPQIKEIEKFKIKKHHLDDSEAKLALQYDYEEVGQPRQFVFRGSRLQYDKRDYVSSGGRKGSITKESVGQQRRVSNTLGMQSQQPNHLTVNYSTSPNALKINSQYFQHPSSQSYSANRPQKDTLGQQSNKTLPKDNYCKQLTVEQNSGRLKKSLSVSEIQLLRKDQVGLQLRLIGKLERIEQETERVERLLREGEWEKRRDDCGDRGYGSDDWNEDRQRQRSNKQRDSREVVKDIQKRRQKEMNPLRQNQIPPLPHNQIPQHPNPNEQPTTQHPITRYKSQTKKLSHEQKERPSHYEKDFSKLKHRLEKERMKEKERLEVELRKMKEEGKRMKEEEKKRRRSFKEMVGKQVNSNQCLQTKAQTQTQTHTQQLTAPQQPNRYLQNLTPSLPPTRQPNPNKLTSHKSLTSSQLQTQQQLLQQHQANLLSMQKITQLQKKYLPKLNVVNKRIQCQLWDPNQQRVRRYLQKPQFLYNDDSGTDDEFSDY